MAVFTPVDGRSDRAWIEERLGDWTTMHSVVPRGYETYVRVFHPVDAQHLEWTGERYVTLEERTLRWSDVAELTGTVAHPLMQWTRIGRDLPAFREKSRGWQYTEPEQGGMPVELLARIAGSLGAAGSSACRAGLWEGNGWLYPGSSTTALASWSPDGEPDVDPPPHVDATIPFGPAEWEDRKLELPNRAYFVFEFELARLTAPSWIEDSGWGWGTSFWGDTPNLLWPLDRSWFLVSEIDFDSTVIGCTAAVAGRLLAEESIEAALVPEGASLMFDADQVNR